MEEGTAGNEKGGRGGTEMWTQMPSISQGAKALETASLFRESKAKEREREINRTSEQGTVRAGNCL